MQVPDVSRIESLKEMFHNPIFITALISFVGSQIIKGLIVFIKDSSTNDKWSVLTAIVWKTGGFPSSHSALVSTLAASSAIFVGFNSTIFIVTLFYAFIIMRDALGVRRSTGLQAKSLNELGKKLEEKLDFKWKPVAEVKGHTPIEVITGAVFGICVSLVYAHFYSAL